MKKENRLIAYKEDIETKLAIFDSEVDAAWLYLEWGSNRIGVCVRGARLELNASGGTIAIRPMVTNSITVEVVND